MSWSREGFVSNSDDEFDALYLAGRDRLVMHVAALCGGPRRRAR